MNLKSSELDDRLARAQQIEDGIIKLYIEMKDRATDVLKESHSRLEEEHRERELLKKENPLVILDRLKASLRILFALKEDSEMQLKEQISTIKAEIETRLISLKAQMEALERQKEEHKQNSIEAIKKRDKAIADKTAIINESNKIIETMKKDNQEMVEILKRKEMEIDKLHKQLDDRDAILRKRDISLHEINNLKSKIKNLSVKHQLELNRMKSEQYKEIQEMRKHLATVDKMKAERDAMKDKLIRTESLLKSYMLNANVIKLQELLKERDKWKKKYLKCEQLLRAKSEELHKMKLHMVTLSEKMSKMKRKKNSQQQQIQPVKIKNVQTKSLKDIQVELDEKNREIQLLTKKVNKMILTERKGKAFENEQIFEQLKNTTTTDHYQPRMKREISSKTQKDLQAHYENLKAISKKHAKAYERKSAMDLFNSRVVTNVKRPSSAPATRKRNTSMRPGSAHSAIKIASLIN